MDKVEVVIEVAGQVFAEIVGKVKSINVSQQNHPAYRFNVYSRLHRYVLSVDVETGEGRITYYNKLVATFMVTKLANNLRLDYIVVVDNIMDDNL